MSNLPEENLAVEGTEMLPSQSDESGVAVAAGTFGMSMADAAEAPVIGLS